MVGSNLESSRTKDKEQATDCFVRLAIADPEWAFDAAADRGPESHQLMMVLAPPRLARALKKLKLRNASGQALLRAQLLCASAAWAAEGDKNRVPQLRSAWRELMRIPEVERDERWKGLAQAPASEVDYPTYLSLAKEEEAKLDRDFELSHFLPTMIATAARHRDWHTFESCVARFRSLPESLIKGHSNVAIANHEGLRALDEQRFADAEAAMRLVLEIATQTPSLSNPDTSALPTRLRCARRPIVITGIGAS